MMIMIIITIRNACIFHDFLTMKFIPCFIIDTKGIKY